MAFIKNISNKTRIEMNEQHGVINGEKYDNYGPAYLTANASDETGHNYRVFIADAKIKASDPETAIALAEQAFASDIELSENMDVIAVVEKHGNGGYLADVRGSYIW